MLRSNTPPPNTQQTAPHPPDLTMDNSCEFRLYLCTCLNSIPAQSSVMLHLIRKHPFSLVLQVYLSHWESTQDKIFDTVAASSSFLVSLAELFWLSKGPEKGPEQARRVMISRWKMYSLYAHPHSVKNNVEFKKHGYIRLVLCNLSVQRCYLHPFFAVGLLAQQLHYKH